MFAMGFSVNTLTLLAMVLAIGLVVDDAIVVLENIYRHIEEGMKPIPAAIKGTREIGFAVIAMALTLIIAGGGAWSLDQAEGALAVRRSVRSSAQPRTSMIVVHEVR